MSTQLTQNVTLLNLLSFASEPRPTTEQYKKLLNYLHELLSVKDQQSAEIVKFLQAILDKLIDLLLDHTTNAANQFEQNGSSEKDDIHSKQIQPCVFKILVAIFQIIENQNKFASFRTVIDAYLSKNFCITLAHRPFLRLFYNMMCNVFEKYNLDAAQFNKDLTTGVPREAYNNFPKLTAIKSQRCASLTSNNDTISVSENGLIFELINSNNNAHDNFDYENVLSTIKSMEYIFKFSFRSRELLSKFQR